MCQRHILYSFLYDEKKTSAGNRGLKRERVFPVNNYYIKPKRCPNNVQFVKKA